MGDFNLKISYGELTRDPLMTFGGYGVVRSPNLHKWLAFMCENGFEHHVAISLSRIAERVTEALGEDRGSQTCRHAWRNGSGRSMFGRIWILGTERREPA